MFEKKFGLGLMGAAALAACSPAEKTPEGAPQEEVIKQVGPETYEVAEPDVVIEPEDTLPSQYTPEQVEEILSGTTQEVDGMSREEIDRLDDSSE
jgi:hypothetical protein